MKKTLPFFIATILFSASQLKAQDYKTALGIRLSSNGPAINNSVSFKHFMNPKLAIEGLFTFDKKAAIGALFEVHNAMPSTEGLKWFYGAGAYLGFDSPVDQTDEEISAWQDSVTFQDMPIVESQRPELLPLDLQEELHLRSDRLAVAYRRWLRELGVTFATA